MTRMKRKLAAVLAALMMLAALAGCGKKVIASPGDAYASWGDAYYASWGDASPGNARG